MAKGCEFRYLPGVDANGPDSKTNCKDLTRPPEPKRSRKHSGATTYRAKFNADWKKESPLVTSVSQDPYRSSLMIVKTHIEWPLEWNLQQAYWRMLKGRQKFVIISTGRSRPCVFGYLF